ncbi:MAG: hypothetical protein ACI4UW_04970 [Muribaculaceae bacterium]
MWKNAAKRFFLKKFAKLFAQFKANRYLCSEKDCKWLMIYSFCLHNATCLRWNKGNLDKNEKRSIEDEKEMVNFVQFDNVDFIAWRGTDGK